MKNKNINKVIFYTILVLCISAFSCFPKSYSKYIKDEEPVKYFVTLDKLYVGKLNTLTMRNTSTYKTVSYMIRFDRSQVMKEYDTEQQIFIEIEQPSCRITNIISNGNVNINGNKATITYNTPGTDTINVDYKCNVLDIVKNENGLDLLYTNVDIYEKFMPEDIKYLYAEVDGTKTLLSNYYTAYPKPQAQISDDGKQLTFNVDTENKYTEFTTWINSYNATLATDYSKDINLYVNSVYDSEEAILNLANKLNGMTVTYDSNTGNYTYRIDDNFLGYARTYYAYEVKSEFTKMDFSNNNLSDNEANQILRYYFESYSGYTTEEIDKIMLYIAKYGSINYMLKPNDGGTYNEIPGFVNLTETDEIGISAKLMDYVDAYINKRITIDFNSNDRANMFILYKNALTSTYDFMTDELFAALTKNANIYISIGKNSTDMAPTPADKTAYTDYFIVKDTNKQYLLKVYSDGVTDTRIELTELGTAEAMIMTSDFAVTITVNNQNPTEAKTNVVEIITNLDNKLGVNYKDKIVDGLFTNSTTIDGITSVIDGNNVTISYTIVLPVNNINEETELTDDNTITETE